MSVCGRGARSERERIPARRSGSNLFKSRDPLPRSPWVRSALLSEPRVAAGLAVGRPPTAGRITPAPDRQTAGDSRPPNAGVILLELLRHVVVGRSSAWWQSPRDCARAAEQAPVTETLCPGIERRSRALPAEVVDLADDRGGRPQGRQVLEQQREVALARRAPRAGTPRCSPCRLTSRAAVTLPMPGMPG